MEVVSAVKKTVLSYIEPSESPEKKFPSRILRDVPGECTYCRKILYVIGISVSRIHKYMSFRIGFVDDVMSSDCKQHTTFFENYAKELALDEEGGEILMALHHNTYTFRFFTERQSTGKWRPWVDIAAGQYTFGTPELKLLGRSGLGVELDPAWVHEQTILNWYEACVKEHGQKCYSPPYLAILPQAEPQLFIDVDQNCLVRARKGASYAALSYVWGQTEMLRTIKATLSHLQEPGALADQDTLRSLPKTVLHAMYLTRKLKITYLWVNALCIVQDDEDMFKTHLPQMGSIYGIASIVITAIDGTDAGHGLRGLRGAPHPSPRNFYRSPIAFGDKSFVTRYPMGDYRTVKQFPTQSYNARGWTFQEHFFSRRSICFENGSVWFRCCCTASYPSNTVMMRVIHDFNQRNLSYPQDCLSAFSGVTACYTKIYTGGFICGLPEMFLDAMLLWQPEGYLTRRLPVASKNKPSAQNIDICLPSWSWVGWQGLLDFSGWKCANNFVANCSGMIAQTDCGIRTGTKWHASSDPNGANRRPVDAFWLDWYVRYKDPAAKLPDGWTKRLKRKNETSAPVPEGYGNYIYKFNNCSQANFWYPSPLGNPTGIPRADGDLPYLFGRVDTAHVYTLGGVSIVEKDNGRRACIALGNEKEEWIGMLRLHSLDYFEKRGLDPGEERVPVQLICISTGFVPNSEPWGYGYVDEYCLKERPVDGTDYEFANVLWISWDGGVARREALGRVEMRRWAALQPEQLEVVLGSMDQISPPLMIYTNGNEVLLPH